MRTPLETLNQKFADAQNKIEVGAIYCHYFNPDLHYKVLCLSINEETEELMVIYKALYGDELIWARKLTLWLETIMHNEVAMPRFTRIAVYEQKI